MKLRKIISFAALSLLLLNLNEIKSSAYNDKYETYKKANQKQIKVSNDEYIPEEVKLDLLEEANMDYLKKKTSKKYEIAMADSNGGYTYVKSFNNLNEAINEVKSIKNKKSTSSEVPVIINEDGIVVYATEAIGRLTRLVDGQASTDKRFNVNIYSTSTSKNAITYVNHGYMDDMPIIAQTSTRVKVEVNGVIGWIDKQESQVVDGKTKTVTNVVQVPLNQAKNLSYYKKSGNDLIHYISSNVAGSGGYSVVIGKAPSFMTDGTKYYSYDGNYFYNSIEKLLVDAENGNHNNAVNSKNIFYNYYLYLPGRTKVSYTVGELNKYLSTSTPEKSILRDKGYEFIQAQNKYGVNASFMVGVAMNESGKGTSSIATSKNNIFGLNAVDASPGQSANYFKSVADCVNEFASHWMSKGYFKTSDWRYNGACLGNKGFGANVRYASDPYWGEKACSYMYDMDKTISGSNSLIEHNKYQLGTYKSATSVKNSSGSTLYSILASRSKSGQVGDPLVILSQESSNYTMYPDTQLQASGEYNWSMLGYVNTSNVTKINTKQSNPRTLTNTKPTISASNKALAVGDSFNAKSNVTSTDKEDGSLTSRIVVKSNNVNTSVPGSYKVVYEVTDSDLNTVTKEISVTVGKSIYSFTVNNINSTSTTITGTGLSGATVKAYVGSKQIGSTATVNSSGKYSITIPAQSANTSVTVKMIKDEYGDQKTLKVIGVSTTSKKTLTTDIYKYDAGKGNYLTYINGKGYSQYTYLNKSGNYAFTPSSWMSAAGLNVTMPTSSNGYTMIIDNNYLTMYNQANTLLSNIKAGKVSKERIIEELNKIESINTNELSVVENASISRASAKKSLTTDINKYDTGSGKYLTYINGKGYSQYSYLNKSGNYAFTPSSWMKAAGLTVTMPTYSNGYTMKITNSYITKYNNVVKQIESYI